MHTLQQLQVYVQDKIKSYPELKGQIIDLLTLCMDEIEEGGSRTHEISLCVSDIEELIKESLEEAKQL